MDVSVLIVDDEVELAESTAEYFNMFDVPSKCVFSAVEALEFFRSNTAKLILLDIHMASLLHMQSSLGLALHLLLYDG